MTSGSSPGSPDRPGVRSGQRSGDRALAVALFAALAGAILLACLIGPTPLGIGRVLAALVGSGSPGDAIVVLEIRLPRALAAAAVGIALGASGAALQGLLRNPLAEPGVLGVSACGAVGATATIFFGIVFENRFILPSAAIIGALAATGLIAFAAARTRSVLTLILIGVGLSSFAGAVMALLTNLSSTPFSLVEMVDWMLGSVANRSLLDLLFAAPFLVAGLALLFGARRGLTALGLGEEAAAGLGLDVRRHRLAVVTGAGLATGASVALAGVIGFVGIVVPHLVRPLVAHDPARSLLPSALLAGVILLAADLAARVAPTNAEMKLGVMAALLGAPVFVWIVARRGATHG